jgi:hypothetical protein
VACRAVGAVSRQIGACEKYQRQQQPQCKGGARGGRPLCRRYYAAVANDQPFP